MPEPAILAGIDRTFAEAGAVFVLVLCVWLCGIVLWSIRRARRAQQLGQRLDVATGEMKSDSRVLSLWIDGRQAGTTLVPGLQQHGLTERLQKLHREAGLESPLSTVLMGIGAVMLVAYIAALLITGSMAIAPAAAIAVLTLVWIALKQRIARRTALFERQLIDALELAARSLRAGHPLVGSLQLIAQEIPAPVGDLFGQIWQQQELGMPLAEALRNASDQIGNDDVKLFATSVIIQLRTGGNLADMMVRLAEVIRERNRLARRIRVLTTQTQFSKRVLIALPFLMFVVLNLINPKYMRPLYSTSSGQMIMAVAAFILLLGWWMMNLMSKLRY